MKDRSLVSFFSVLSMELERSVARNAHDEHREQGSLTLREEMIGPDCLGSYGRELEIVFARKYDRPLHRWMEEVALRLGGQPNSPARSLPR